MGIYTSYNQSWIDTQIDSKLSVIVNTILNDVQGVKSIVLTGGFGRGEGSIQIDGNGELRLLKDFDLVAIVDRKPAPQSQAQLLDKVYRQLNLKNTEFEQFRFSHFVIDIRYMREKDLAYPDIWFYDLKSGSKILYGRAVANLIPYNANDIPLSSGFRILFEKVTGLLGHFPYRYFSELTNKSNNFMDRHEQDSLIYECLKSYIEMCTALCILTKHYRPSYQERMKVIKQIYSRELSDLAGQLPQLPEIVERATLFKLKPDPALLPKIHEEDDLLDLWFTTRNHLGIVIRYYLSKYTGRDIKDWADLPKLKDFLYKIYYIPLFESWIKQRIGRIRFKRGLCSVMNTLYHLLINFEYINEIKKDLGKIYLKPLRRPISPSLKFYLAGPLILFSLDREGAITKPDYIKTALDELRLCIPIDLKDGRDEWDVARKHYLLAYRLYSGYHMVK